MIPCKKEVKPLVLNALRTFTKRGDMTKLSCVFVGHELTEKYKNDFYCVYYSIALETLESSEDSSLYFFDTLYPFLNYELEREQREDLRKRFCELTIKNLESGIFDVNVKPCMDYGANDLSVELILAK